MAVALKTFGRAREKTLPGPLSIGHVRYSTAGPKGAVIRDVQPFFGEFSMGAAAIAHNGNLVNIEEIRNPDLDATLVAHSVAEQIGRRISYRRAARMAVSRSMQNGALGIKIICKGRLAGAEIARKEKTMEGRVPLHTLKADIDYSIAEAHTEYGRIGVKVWIYRGDIEISKQTHVEPSEIKPIELTLTPELSSNESDTTNQNDLTGSIQTTTTKEEKEIKAPDTETKKPKATTKEEKEIKAPDTETKKPKATTKKTTTKKTTKNKDNTDDTNL